ncbi:MAG: hypothetical protein HUK20_14500 [Fibrobacter sp.]|nr:hypothetical protein [Fibrobacter sp.]
MKKNKKKHLTSKDDGISRFLQSPYPTTTNTEKQPQDANMGRYRAVQMTCRSQRAMTISAAPATW